MEQTLLFDMHTHSDNSPDGEHSVTLMCEKAVEKGIGVLAVTDHCECNAYRSEHYDRSCFQSFFEVTKAQAVFSDRITLLRGVELGQPTQDLQAAAEALAAHRYDFVLASLHNCAGKPDFYYIEDYLSLNVKALLEEYFAQLYQVVEWGGFDSLAHLTYPLRYMTGRDGVEVDQKLLLGLADEVLRLLAQKGKAIEINTSTLSLEKPFTMPALPLLRRFKELGGELVTVGSDAHTADRVGFGIREGIEVAKAAGFEYAALFKGRVPQRVQLW